MDANLKSKLKKVLVVLGIAAGVFALLAGIYFYGSLHYPQSLQQAYQEKDCETVLDSHSMITRFYPYRSLQENTTGLALACALYTNAEKLQKDGKWLDAYQTYKTCAETYPDGLLASDANQQAASSLLSLAGEQHEQKSYQESLDTLKLLMGGYPDTTQALDLFADVHLSWGSEYQTQASYQSAEEKFLNLKNWAEAGEHEEHVNQSRAALSNLYLTWGKNYQSADELEQAMEKYRQAVEIAPESEAASQARQKHIEILLLEGEEQVAAEDFQTAIETYQQGLAIENPDSIDSLNSATAQAYIAWSRQNVNAEDYYQALEKIETAAKLDLPASTIQDVESFKQEIYIAFANSSGTQAKNLMQEVSRTSCKQEKKNAFPPILGINSESALFALHGLNKDLPEKLIAKTPGELRYIVCVNVKSEIVESKTVYMVHWDPYKKVGVRQYNETFTRTQFLWEISIFDLTTGQILVQKDIKGSEPAPLQIYDQDYFYVVYNQPRSSSSHPFPSSTVGSLPDINDLIKLLNEIIS